MLMRTNWLRELRCHPLFAALDESQYERIAREARVIEAPAGTVLVAAGEVAGAFFLVASGSAKLSLYAPNGDEKVLELLGPGRSFAEALLFAEAPRYPVTAVTLEDSVVLRVPAEGFRALLHENNAACFRMLAHLAARLHSQVREIEALTLENARQRLIRFLATRVVLDDSGAAVARLSEPRAVIASHLGVQPETLSRLIKTLIDEDLVETNGRDLVIADMERLLAA
jgi:CRP/FNR family transcriptional regulator, dissimilatory nitrate respiration regulator